MSKARMQVRVCRYSDVAGVSETYLVEVWQELYEAINNVIDNVTIADLVNRRQK